MKQKNEINQLKKNSLKYFIYLLETSANFPSNHAMSFETHESIGIK